MARVTLLYYTGVWAVVSTLMIYLVTRFELSQVATDDERQRGGLLAHSLEENSHRAANEPSV